MTVTPGMRPVGVRPGIRVGPGVRVTGGCEGCGVGDGGGGVTDTTMKPGVAVAAGSGVQLQQMTSICSPTVAVRALSTLVVLSCAVNCNAKLV